MLRMANNNLKWRLSLHGFTKDQLNELTAWRIQQPGCTFPRQILRRYMHFVSDSPDNSYIHSCSVVKIENMPYFRNHRIINYKEWRELVSQNPLRSKVLNEVPETGWFLEFQNLTLSKMRSLNEWRRHQPGCTYLQTHLWASTDVLLSSSWDGSYYVSSIDTIQANPYFKNFRKISWAEWLALTS